MKITKKEIIYIFTVIMAVLFLLMIILQIPKIQQDLQLNIRKNMVNSVSSILDNFEQEFRLIAAKHPGKDLYTILKNDPHLRYELETQLALIAGKDIKYTYVLYRDGDHKYRFMLDGAISDKAEFGMKFDIDNNAWKTLYATKQPQLIEQDQQTNLWITYLKPIIIDNEVQGVIAADFSLEGHNNIIDIIKPFEHYLLIFLGLILLGILATILQYLFFRLSQKRVFIDPLTGLYNRNFLNEVITALDYQKYAIAMLDLDKFKIINDTYGHEVGDSVLCSVSNELKKSIRENDKLVRYGGEEFIIFLSMRDLDQKQILQIMERIRYNVGSLSIKSGSITIKPTISIGLNTYTSHFKNIHDAISIADKMLYEAKRTGRNKVVKYSLDSIYTDDCAESFNVHHVKNAIEEKRLFCEYQPIVDLQTNTIVGYEALIRIRNHDGKIVYPGTFLPKIAYSNIYKELTNELLQMNFKKAHDEKCCISINLNITDVLDNDIYGVITEYLEKNKEEAPFFTFELLEEEQINDLINLQIRVQHIRSLGSRISIDDFGSGYSNFNHIFALDVDVIKIDGSLIKEIDTSEISRKLVESIVAFAHASKKRVVAEYVHSPEILKIVKELKISYGQGFFLGKPSEILATKIKGENDSYEKNLSD